MCIFRILLLILFALIVSACQPERTDAEHVSSAKEHIQKGELAASIIELKSALQKNPENAEARRLLGELYVQVGNGQAAEKELRQAMELGVAREALMLTLTKALAMQNEYQKLLDEIEAPSTLSSEQQAKIKSYRGDAWLSLGKPDKAKFEYESALQLYPTEPLAKLGLAKIALIEQDMNTANKLVEEALKYGKEDAALWRFKAYLKRVQGDLKKAEELYTKALELNSEYEEAVDLANRALIRIGLDNLEGASQDVKRLRQIAKDYYLTHFAAGLLALKQKKYEQAKTELERALELNDRHLLTYYNLGLANLMLGNNVQAETLLSKFVSHYPRWASPRRLLALAQLGSGNLSKARKTLEPLLQVSPEDSRTLEILAKIEFADGNQEKGFEYLERLVSLDPEAPEYRSQLGMMYLQVKNIKQGISELEKAVELDPESLQRKAQLAVAYIKAKKYQNASSVIQELLNEMPDSALPLNLLAAMQLNKGEKRLAKKTLQKAWRLQPGNVSTASNLARILLEEKEFQEAIKVYRAALESHPRDLGLLIEIADLEMKRRRPDNAIKYLTRALEQNPAAIAPKILLAEIYIKQGKFQQAQDQLNDVIATDPNNLQALYLKTKAQFASGQDAAALRTAQRLLNVEKPTAKTLDLVAKVYKSLGNFEEAERLWRRAVAADPDLIPARLALLKIKMLRGGLTSARDELNQLTEKYPDNPGVLALRGEYAALRGKWQEAIAFYEKALSRASDSLWTINLARVYWFAGRPDKAKERLENWLERYPEDKVVRYAYANLLRKLGQSPAAIGQLRELLKRYPDYAMALNDLAWLLREKDKNEALLLARRAAKLAPDMPEIRDTLAWLLYLNGKNEESLQEMKGVIAQNPSDPSSYFRWAMILAANGRERDAATVLDNLLKRTDPFPEREKAVELLKKLQL